ncbi:MAG: hypothetical protein JNL10_12275 [Verrucomicrobiales bacterium]|nr:hypothetical protein [Verrucomicrobiales bacterium]
MTPWSQVKAWLVDGDWPELCRIDPILAEHACVEDGWLEELAFVEPERRSVVDSIAREFAATGELPPLEPVVRCLFSLRLDFARGLAIALSAAESEPGGRLPLRVPRLFSRAQRVQWLLVDAWDTMGCHQWEGFGYWLSDWMRVAEGASELRVHSVR